MVVGVLALGSICCRESPLLLFGFVIVWVQPLRLVHCCLVRSSMGVEWRGRESFRGGGGMIYVLITCWKQGEARGRILLKSSLFFLVWNVTTGSYEH